MVGSPHLLASLLLASPPPTPSVTQLLGSRASSPCRSSFLETAHFYKLHFLPWLVVTVVLRYVAVAFFDWRNWQFQFPSFSLLPLPLFTEFSFAHPSLSSAVRVIVHSFAQDNGGWCFATKCYLKWGFLCWNHCEKRRCSNISHNNWFDCQQHKCNHASAQVTQHPCSSSRAKCYSSLLPHHKPLQLNRCASSDSVLLKSMMATKAHVAERSTLQAAFEKSLKMLFAKYPTAVLVSVFSPTWKSLRHYQVLLRWWWSALRYLSTSSLRWNSSLSTNAMWGKRNQITTKPSRLMKRK